MSYIFRSDDVQPGERVVARREVTITDAAGTRRVHTDVIGHVLSTTPLVIRPQEVGGYPSALEAVEIPEAELKIVKRLSPRMVRNSEIRAIETAAASTDEGQWSSDRQWFLCLGGANGATSTDSAAHGHYAVPLGASAGFSPAPIAEIDAFFAHHLLPTRLLIPERIGKPAERLLDAGWDLGAEVAVLARRELPSPSQAAGDTAPTARPSAVGPLGQAGDGAVWARLFSPSAPGMDWAARHGASAAYALIPIDDSAALARFAELGFIEHHRRRFATRIGGTL